MVSERKAYRTDRAIVQARGGSLPSYLENETGVNGYLESEGPERVVLRHQALVSCCLLCIASQFRREEARCGEESPHRWTVMACPATRQQAFRSRSEEEGGLGSG